MNAQESAYRYARTVLFDACGASIDIRRSGASVLKTRAILAQTKYEDSDPTTGAAYSNFVDVLIYGSNQYTPTTGDVVVVEATGETFVVKPILSNVWKWDDPYRLVLRFYAQRRAIETASGSGEGA